MLQMSGNRFLYHSKNCPTEAGGLLEGSPTPALFRKGFCQNYLLVWRSPAPSPGLPEVMSQEAELETLICGQALRLKTRETFLESELG